MESKEFKNKVLTGVSWSFLEQIITYLSVFFFGIVLARLITPEEFGLVGIIGIFLGVLPLFIDGGFASALKQSKECTHKEFSTVFYFNLSMSIILYIILFFSADYIAKYFDNLRLISLIRVLGLNLILSALFSIQVVILSRKLDFKVIAKVSSVSQITSGIIAILFAFLQYGVWSLVIRSITQSLIIILLYYRFSSWRPSFFFDINILKKLFSYGSYLFLGSFINVLFNNAFTFVIGKYYSPTQLGYYTRANNFSMLPSQNLTMIVQKVAFPAFSKIQEDKYKLLAVNRKVMSLVMFISSILMVGLMSSSESFVITLVGENWRPIIIYLQMLCIVYLLLPANSINVNILNIVGRSDLSLKLVFFKNVLMLPVILVGVFNSIINMLWAWIFYSIIVFFMNMFWSNELIGYSIKKQLNDIMPSILFSVIVGLLIFYIPNLFSLNNYFVILVVKIIIGFCSTVAIGELFKYTPYLDLKNVINDYVFIPIKKKFYH